MTETDKVQVDLVQDLKDNSQNSLSGPSTAVNWPQLSRSVSFQMYSFLIS